MNVELKASRLTKDFWEQGFLMLDKFFEPALMDHLNQVILNHYGLDPAFEHSDAFIEKSATEVIPWFPFREGNQEFLPISSDERLVHLTRHVLGENWQSLYLMAMFSKQRTKGQAWHQDSPPELPGYYNLNRLFYTHDINELTGGKTIVVPGSHRKGAIPVGDPHGDLEGQVELSPKKGTLILLHGHLWHRVLPIKNTYRISVNARAIPFECPEDITDIAVYRNMRYRFSTNEIVEDRVKKSDG